RRAAAGRPSLSLPDRPEKGEASATSAGGTNKNSSGPKRAANQPNDSLAPAIADQGIFKMARENQGNVRARNRAEGRSREVQDRRRSRRKIRKRPKAVPVPIPPTR